jgi:hypothetical protein
LTPWPHLGYSGLWFFCRYFQALSVGFYDTKSSSGYLFLLIAESNVEFCGHHELRSRARLCSSVLPTLDQRKIRIIRLIEYNQNIKSRIKRVF